MALPAGYVLVEPQKTKLPEGYTLVSQKGTDQEGLPSIAKRAPREEPREAPVYDPLGQVIGDVPAPLDYAVEGQGRMNEPGAFTTIADLAKQFIAPGAKAPFALPQATETAVKGLARQAMEGTPEAIMPSSVFQPGLDTEETLFGPETDVQKARRKLQAQRAVAAMPSIPGAAALNKIGENVQKDIQNSLSPEAKKALKESQVTGNIFKGEVDFGTNPNAYGYALQAANVFGSMAPVIATAMVTKSPGAGGFVGGTMAADEAATSAAEFINKIPDAELRQKSPFYAELISGGASPKEARALTIKKAAESGAALQGLVATFGDVLTGKLVTGAFDKTIAKLGTNRLARAGGVGAASSLEEAIQETGEGLSSDIALKNVIPSKELGEDSAANFILGALGGAGPGVVKGAFSEGEAKAPEREKYVKPEGGLAELIARQKGFLTPEGRPPAPPAAPAAQAPMPPAPPAGPAEVIQAPGSESMDTQAMLEELINSVNLPPEKPAEPKVEKPVEAPPVEAPAAVESPKEEAPQEEPTLKEQYDRAAKLNFASGDAFRNKFINQEQLDKIRSDYERIKTEYQASIPKAELNPIQQEATDIADKFEALGLKPFADGMRTSIEKNQVKEQNLDFYRTKLKQEQAKQTTLEEGVERPSEKWNWNEFYGDDTKGLDKLKLFNSKAPPAVKQTLQDLTDSIQAVTDRLNDEGYAMRGAAELNVPDEIKNLRSQIMLRSAEGSLLINKFEALNKGFKRSKNTTNQQNLDTAIQEAKAGITEAQKSLQRSIPEPEEVVNARAGLAEANKRVEDLQYKSESLWGALKGKLNPEEVREIFGPNPNLGNKKLGVTKKSGLRGTYISEMADDGLLDAFLPVGMRRASGNFDSAQASQYIKDAVANKDYLPDDAKEEIKQIYRAVEPLGDLIDEYLTIEEQNRELQIAFDEQREADQAAEIVEPEGENRPAEPSEGQERKPLELTAPTKDELKSKQDEIDRLSKENERLSKEAERKAKADEEAKDFVLTGSKRDADQAAARGQKDIFAEAPAEEAPKDNKQEIADLRAEQKVLIRQIIKAGLQETLEQEARMAEIDRRINELEGKPAKKPVEKVETKQRSVEEIREELEDLQDQAEEELNKDKKKKLASDVYKLQGELAIAEGRAARAAAEEEPEEAPAEEAEEPSFEVETPEGNTLSYPAAYGLVNTGYKVLSLNDPRTYTDKGGTQHRTFEKDGARIAVSPNQVLFEWKGRVQYGMGNPNELTLEMLAVDPKDRGKGKGTQVLKDLTKVADQYGITLYGEPVPIVNLKQKDVGLDFDQLVNLYKKFDFKFQETDSGVSERVIVRQPEAEVLPAEEPQIAGQVGFEPYTIEGDFTEVAEEQQRLMLEDQTENLSDAQVSTLEKHYGAKIDSDEFFTKLREDVSNFIVKGATAVNGKIRAIIRQLANGVLAVGIAFNPQYMSQPLNVMMPTDNVRTEEVLAKVPDAATAKMSEPAKRAFAVIYPAIQEQMVAKDKLFIMADKPSGRVFVFNPDGSLLLEKKSLFGLAKGDLYVGDNDKPQNRITPAGLFDLKLVDAKKGESEKRTAGDYDTGTVLAINDPDGTITIMHSVWLKEKDAAQRAAALRNESPADSRYSFGCINVDAPTYSFLVNNHAKQMDGAALFIVPEAGTDVMSFITGKGAMSEDLARIKVKPVTKEVRTPQRQATQTEAKTKTPGREQQFFSLEEGLVNMVNSMADDMAEDEKKRSPSLKRQVKTYNRQRKNGKMSDEMFVMMADSAIREDEERRMAEEPKPRKRGYLHIQNRLNEAVQANDISREAYDLANWFMLQNEDLVADLGVSIKAKGQAGAGGFYNNLSRVFTLIKGASSDVTATHEILHHLERMMPTKIQQGIRKAWLTQLTKAAKATKDPVQKLYFEAVIDANIGDNRHAMVNVPEGAGKAYSNARMAMEDVAGGNTSTKLAEVLLLQGAVPMDMYQYFNPSEFWAVNGTRIVEGRYEAVKGGNLSKLKNWLRDLGQTIKSLFGLKSDASIIRALDSLAKSDGKFVTDEMLGAGQEYKSIERRNYEGGEAPEPDMEIPEMSFMDDTIYKFGDKLIDTKRLIESIKKTGKKLNEQFDAYLKEENYHGRLAKRTSDFLDDEMRPVLQEMQDKNVSLDELETFLLNRHAKEANAYIAKINPTGFPEAGSSVSDADADKYMAALTPEKRKDLMALAAKVDKIVKETQRVLVANGLETQDTIDEWNKTYKNYVPLMRDQLDFVHTGRGVMGGFATRGSASKRRVGSDKPVIDIFANIAMQRERALRRSEQARVGRALYGMAIKHPNPGFWLAINPDAIKDKDKLEAELISLGLTPEDARNIIQEPRQPMFDKKTGTVKYQVNPLLRNSPNVFPVRINGEDRFIFFNPNDPRALRMVEAIKNLDTERLGDVLGTVGMVTRWFASVNTQYNIVFGGVNFLRDLGAASLNLSTTEIAGKEKEVRANVLPALRAIYRDLRGKGATTKEMAEMQDWFERFQLAGGQTGYQNQFAETKRKGNIVEQELKRLNRGNVKKSVDAVFDWLSDYNDAIENSVRLSAFKVAVESGLSEDKAASIAKNLTVNFNRKGARTGLIASLYAFFNAAVQGSARMIETLRGPMGKKIIYGGMFLGAMQAVVLAMAGFDDDEPPEFVKDKNFIIPIPFTDKKYLSIPMPLGFNIFPGLGRLAMEELLIQTGTIRSRKSAGDKMMSAVSLVFDAFNPLGGAGNPLLMVMPTILDPFAAIYSNRDAFGRPIYKEDRGTAPTPGYERSRENASTFSKKLAEAINWATSPAGTQHTKGALSPTADQIDYFIGQITGGVGREIMKVGEFVKSKAVTQEEVPAYKLPIVGRFYGEADSPAATRSRFYENVKEMAKHEHEIKGLRKDKVSPAEYIKANPEARLWQRANNIENQIVKLNKEKKALIEKDAPREAVKRKEDEILKKMTDFNDQVRRGQ
jgi:GNAT superfamily N-acetyltransferase